MYIYLLEDVTDGGNFIYKIGFTTNLVKRMQAHKTSNPDAILIKSFKTNYNRKVETALKNYFKKKLYFGEWFFLEEGDINNFIPLCEKFEKNFICLNDNPFF